MTTTFFQGELDRVVQLDNLFSALFHIVLRLCPKLLLAFWQCSLPHYATKPDYFLWTIRYCLAASPSCRENSINKYMILPFWKITILYFSRNRNDRNRTKQNDVCLHLTFGFAGRYDTHIYKYLHLSPPLIKLLMAIIYFYYGVRKLFLSIKPWSGTPLL